jgi:coatomer subunit beta'
MHVQEKTTLKLDFNAEGIFGGSLVGVKSADYIVFYDWEVSAYCVDE